MEINEDGVFDGNSDDNFSLHTLDNTFDFCEKSHCLSIEWNYFTNGRALKIIDYVLELLLETDMVEIWNIWLDVEFPKIITTSININNLEVSHIENLLNSDLFDEKILSRYDQPYTGIFYCLKITK